MMKQIAKAIANRQADSLYFNRVNTHKSTLKKLDMWQYPNEYLKLCDKHDAFFSSSNLLNYFYEIHYFVLKTNGLYNSHTFVVKPGSFIWLFGICIHSIAITNPSVEAIRSRRPTSSLALPSLSPLIFQIYDFVSRVYCEVYIVSN